jgi:signal transduction histidine kinase
MASRAGRWLAWGSLVGSLLLALAALYLVTHLPAQVPANRRPSNTDFTYALLALAFSILGAFLASRRDRNPVAWMACAIGLGINLAGFAAVYELAAEYAPGRYPGGRLATIAGSAGWDIGLGIAVTFLPLLFPDGRLVSRRLRPVAWLAAIGIALLVLGDWLSPIPELPGIGAAIGGVALFALLAVTVAVIGSLVVRYRRGGAVERLQLKWFMAAAISLGLTLVVETILQAFHVVLPGLDLAFNLIVFGLPASIAIAVLKYRLYEIDLVINRALVYGALAFFIAAVYVAIVVGIGDLIRSRGQFSLALSILATALVALAFQPVRRRIERWANQLVYGTRSTPYEALAEFSNRVASAYPDEEVLSRLARVLVQGTGATVASVWMRRSGDPFAAATWPESEPPLRPGDADRAVQVRHQGDLLGELVIKKRTGEPLTLVEDKLLTDLAAQAGQLLRNVRLTAELQARVREVEAQAVELRISRQRIVAAQDAERRRLERNIHDGAQQHLVALAVKIRLATSMVKRDPARARVSLIELEEQTSEALETLRQLARGLYPPTLREHGLVEALRQHSEVSALGVGRYDPELEAAVYFCCLEALQNAAKHSHAANVRVRLEERAGQLHFAVVDDGVGFNPAQQRTASGLQNMTDRIASLGGRLSVESRPGRGTTISGELPIAAVAVAGR